MNFPKVLIVGQSFDNYTGPGITNTNLFSDWPYETIAIISSTINENWKICGLQYLIGQDEAAKCFPFSLLQDGHPSIIINKEKIISEKIISPKTEILKEQKLFKRQILRNILKSILNFIGIFLLFNRLKLSDKLSMFIQDFQPDIIYTQLASIELIYLVNQIHEKHKVPIALHIMDDWPVMIHKTGLLGHYWNARTQSAFVNLINKSSVHLSISEAMSIEYKHRYGKDWVAFHNPIDRTFMNTNEKENLALEYNLNRLLYIGRIGKVNEESILFIAQTIIEMNTHKKNIEFVIYTKDFKHEKLNKLATNNCIKIFQDVPHNSVPFILKSAGVLILPLDFSKYSQKFARFSMPSKATEYMASGVPVIVFGPLQNALTIYASEKKWGFVVTQEDRNLLQNAIVELLNNNDLRHKMVTNATSMVLKNHIAENVREMFRKALSLKNDFIES